MGKQAKQTPVEQGMNIGPKCAPELVEVGVPTLEKLREIGWEEAYRRVCTAFPDRIHSMYAYALMGAEKGCNLLELDELDKVLARRITKEIRISCKP